MLGIVDIRKDECKDCGGKKLGVEWENVWAEHQSELGEDETETFTVEVRRILKSEMTFTCLPCFQRHLRALAKSHLSWLAFMQYAEEHHLWSPTVLRFLADRGDVRLKETEETP